MNRQLALFMTAVQFLTRLPAPRVAACEPAALGRSARYFPLVGVLVGLINVGVWWLAAQRLPAALAVGLMLGASALATGALHEDGFADACDGFGGGASRERVLSIMQDSRIGAYGALGLVLLIGLKWTTLASLAASPVAAAFPLLVIGAHAMSRWCAAALIWRLPYARTEGDAKSRPFADALTARGWLGSGLIGLAGFAPIAAGLGMTGAAGPSAGLATALAAGACAAAAVAALAAGYCRRRLGGYTGDCLGATQQLAELAFLLGGLAALAPSRAVSWSAG